MQLTLFDEIFEEQNTGDPLLETLLLRGSGFEGGKKRIYEYVMTNPPKAKLVTFLKDEYGMGGFGTPIRGINTIISEHHDASGIRFIGINGNGETVEGKITWHQAAEAIVEMVEKGLYIGS